MNLREPFLYHKAGLTLLSAKISSLPSTHPVVEQIFGNYENTTLAKMSNADLQLYLEERAIFQEQNLNLGQAGLIEYYKEYDRKTALDFTPMDIFTLLFDFLALGASLKMEILGAVVFWAGCICLFLYNNCGRNPEYDILKEKLEKKKRCFALWEKVVMEVKNREQIYSKLKTLQEQ